VDITTVTYRRNGQPRQVEVSRYLGELDKLIKVTVRPMLHGFAIEGDFQAFCATASELEDKLVEHFGGLPEWWGEDVEWVRGETNANI
jgi:hypothetical protein